MKKKPRLKTKEIISSFKKRANKSAGQIGVFTVSLRAPKHYYNLVNSINYK